MVHVWMSKLLSVLYFKPVSNVDMLRSRSEILYRRSEVKERCKLLGSNRKIWFMTDMELRHAFSIPKNAEESIWAQMP